MEVKGWRAFKADGRVKIKCLGLNPLSWKARLTIDITTWEVALGWVSSKEITRENVALNPTKFKLVLILDITTWKATLWWAKKKKLTGVKFAWLTSKTIKISVKIRG